MGKFNYEKIGATFLQGLPNVEYLSHCILSFDNEYLIIENVNIKGILKRKVEVLNTFKIKHEKIINKRNSSETCFKKRRDFFQECFMSYIWFVMIELWVRIRRHFMSREINIFHPLSDCSCS